MPVTGTVAPGTGAGGLLIGVSTAKAGSESKLTDALPAESVEFGSVTKDVPFQIVTSLAGSMFGEPKVSVTGLRNVPANFTPFTLIVIPAPHTTVRPDCGGIAARSGAVIVTCTGIAKAPAGTVVVRMQPSTVSGPTVPPPVPMVTEVTIVLNPPGGRGVDTGGGPYPLSDDVAARAAPPVAQVAAKPMRTTADSLRVITLSSRFWACWFLLGGIKTPLDRVRAAEIRRGVLNVVEVAANAASYPQHRSMLITESNFTAARG